MKKIPLILFLALAIIAVFSLTPDPPVETVGTATHETVKATHSAPRPKVWDVGSKRPPESTKRVIGSPNEDELHKLVNVERAKVGLPALVRNDNLNKSAAAKCQNMIDEDHTEHVSPSGMGLVDFIKPYYHNGERISENLAYGYRTSAKVVNGWMGSTEGHREAMLSTTYTQVGYAVCNKGTLRPFVAQHLIQL